MRQRPHGNNLTFPISNEGVALSCLRLNHQIIRGKTPLQSNQSGSYAHLLLQSLPVIYRCQRVATEAMAAAGPLGISREEAARRGVEVDRILRQREEDSPANNVSSTPPSGVSAEPVAEKRVESGPRRGGSEIIPHVGKLEDRKASGIMHVIMLIPFSVTRIMLIVK